MRRVLGMFPFNLITKNDKRNRYQQKHLGLHNNLLHVYTYACKMA